MPLGVTTTHDCGNDIIVSGN